MAESASGDFRNQIDGISECPVCSDKMVNNRILPCGHTFCLSCLEKYKRTTKPKAKSLPCPVCREEFTIPKGGCSSLPKNFALQRLIEVENPNASNTLNTLCEICDKNSATVHCVECQQNLCSECEQLHGKLRSSSNHHVVPVSKTSDYKFEECGKKISYCQDHPGYALELMCNSCNSPICWKCRSLAHSSHMVDDIEDLANGHSEQLQSNIDDIDHRLMMLGKITENIKDQEKTHQKNFEAERGNVSKVSAELIRFVVTNEEKYVSQLSSVMKRNIAALQPHKMQTEKQISQLQQHKSLMQMIHDRGNPWEIIKESKEYHDITERLLKASIVSIEEPKISKLTETEIKEKLLGSVSSRNMVSSVYSNDQTLEFPPELPPRRSPSSCSTGSEMSRSSCLDGINSRQDEFATFAFDRDEGTCGQKMTKRLNVASYIGSITGGGSSINGVTMIEDEIYVAAEDSSEIQVYSSETLSLLRKILVRDLQNPNDLISSPNLNCLFLIDWLLNTIFRVETAGKEVTRWSTEGDVGSISLADDADVLLAGHNSSSLKQYSSMGKLIQTVVIKSDVGDSIRPWHSVKLKSGQFIISYGSSGPDSLQRVCLVGTDGRVLKSFGDRRACGSDGLRGPFHLALDDMANVFVADTNNARIAILNSNLAYKAEIAAELRKPRRLYMDKSSKKIYVTDNAVAHRKATDGKVIVFSLSPFYDK